MNESRQPVTREELDVALERYMTKNEFGAFVQLFMKEQERLAGNLSAMGERLVGLISASEERLRVDIGRAARVAAEEHRRELRVLDDRYRDLPGRVDALERGLREHVEDAAAHGRRPRRRR